MARPKQSKASSSRRRMGRVGSKRKTTSQPLVATIQRVLSRSLETKYVAKQNNLSGYTVLGKCEPHLDAISLLTEVAQQSGTGGTNTRVGDQIEPTRASIKGHIWLDNIDADVGSVIFVKLFFVTAKAVKTVDNKALLPDGFLEDGGFDPASWTAARQDLQAFYPIATKNYTLLKSKTFKFVKNGGLPIGNQPGDGTNIGKDRYTFSYSWTPPTLKYGDNADTFPTNHAPFMFAVAYSPGYNYSTDSSLVGRIKMNWNTDMFFKDA